jgi:ABC-type bacteriocin/lantibiotic exporter with double-glycine peptidase domain
MSELIDGLNALGVKADGVRLSPAAFQQLSGPTILFVHGSHFEVAFPIVIV